MNVSGFQIYKNVEVFAEKYRGLKIISEKLDESAYIKLMEKQDYIMIEAKPAEETLDNKRDKIFIFILSPTSKYIKNSKHFMLLDHMINRKKRDIVNMILITKDPVNSHIRRKIVELKKSENGAIITNNYTYDIFKQVIPEAKNVTIPQHIIVKDPQKVMAEDKVDDLAQYPKINIEDPMIIWIGAKVGDLIQIIGPSETAGLRVGYRYVIG